MALLTVRPTAADVAFANFIASHTNPPTEEAAGTLTWGADEHILACPTAAWSLYTRNQIGPIRQTADHILPTTSSRRRCYLDAGGISRGSSAAVW
jgi:hypothetical protein